MQLAVQENGDVRILRVGETRLTYPTLSAFFTEVRQLVDGGARKLLIDLSSVSYIDSAAIGCLMDIHRLLQDKGGVLRLAAPQSRVETMISMTGVHKIIGLHRDEAAALAAFGAPAEPKRARGKGDA